MPFMGKMLRIAVPVLVVGIAATVLLVRKPWERVATIPAGTTLVAALEEDVSKDDSRVGDEIELLTVGSIQLANGAEVPEGSELTGQVMMVSGGGTHAGPTEAEPSVGRSLPPGFGPGRCVPAIGRTKATPLRASP